MPIASSGSVMRQGGQSSSFLLALDFGKEIHSGFHEVMLGQNFMLAKSLCFVYSFFIFLSLFVCLLLLFVFFSSSSALSYSVSLTHSLFPLSGKQLATQQILVWHLCPLLSLLPSPY